MGRFTLVENDMWDDQAFSCLDTDARLLFLGCWTNPQSTICGLYLCPVSLMRKMLTENPPADEERVHAALEELARKPIVLYDYDSEVVWVVNRARHANRSPKVARAMQKEVERCPSSPLVGEFVKKYARMLELRLAP